MLGVDAMWTPIPASSCTAFQYLSRCANPDSTLAPASPLVRGQDCTTHPNCTTGTRKPRRREGDKCVFAQVFFGGGDFRGKARLPLGELAAVCHERLALALEELARLMGFL